MSLSCVSIHVRIPCVVSSPSCAHFKVARKCPPFELSFCGRRADPSASLGNERWPLFANPTDRLAERSRRRRMPLEISHVLLHSCAGGRVDCGKDGICILFIPCFFNSNSIFPPIALFINEILGESVRHPLHCPLLPAKTLRPATAVTTSLRLVSVYRPLHLPFCSDSSPRLRF